MPEEIQIIETTNDDGTLSVETVIPVIESETESEPEIEPEETPWQLGQSEINEITSLMRETILEVRNQNQAYSTLVPSLLETNQQLTAQITQLSVMMTDLSTRLALPIVAAIQTPRLVDLQTESQESADQTDNVEVEAVEVTEEKQTGKQRRKFRRL